MSKKSRCRLGRENQESSSRFVGVDAKFQRLTPKASRILVAGGGEARDEASVQMVSRDVLAESPEYNGVDHTNSNNLGRSIGAVRRVVVSSGEDRLSEKIRQQNKRLRRGHIDASSS